MICRSMLFARETRAHLRGIGALSSNADVPQKKKVSLTNKRGVPRDKESRLSWILGNLRRKSTSDNATHASSQRRCARSMARLSGACVAGWRHWRTGQLVVHQTLSLASALEEIVRVVAWVVFNQSSRKLTLARSTLKNRSSSEDSHRRTDLRSREKSAKLKLPIVHPHTHATPVSEAYARFRC